MNRGIIIIFILELFVTSCVTQNDSYWEDSLGCIESDEGKVLLADPYILVYDDTYYAYGTYGLGFYVYISSDLKYWERYDIPVLKSEDSWGEKWFWAPEVYYNESDEMFYMYYSAEMWLCIASAKSPLGPFVQENKLPLWYGIDPTVFKDDFSFYLCFVGIFDKSIISIAPMLNSSLFDTENVNMIVSPSQMWEGEQTNEGPCIVKTKDKYIMTYSGNDYTTPDYGIGVAVADDPMGPWEKYEGNPVFRYPVYKGVHLEGVGHNSLFKDLEGNWRMVFHAHSAKGIEGGRYMYIVSCELQDTPPYIVFKDDIFPARLISERPKVEGTTNK